MCGYMSDAEWRQAQAIELAALRAREKREAEAKAEMQRRLDKQRADEALRKAIAARATESNRQHALDHSAAGKRHVPKRVSSPRELV